MIGKLLGHTQVATAARYAHPGGGSGEGGGGAGVGCKCSVGPRLRGFTLAINETHGAIVGPGS
jgi:hypothetical protein